METKTRKKRMTATERAAAMMAFQLWQAMWRAMGHETTAPFSADGDYAGEVVDFMRRLHEENRELRAKNSAMADRLDLLGEDPDHLDEGEA